MRHPRKEPRECGQPLLQDIDLRDEEARVADVSRPLPGAYCLLLHLPRRTGWHRAGGGSRTLARGWYVYSGSAGGGLQGRLRRHLRTHEVRHWHIDTLLAAGRVADVQLFPTVAADAECRLSDAVSGWLGSRRVAGFGASDCSCDSHLSYFEKRPGDSLRSWSLTPQIDRIFQALHAQYADYTLAPHDPFRTLVSCVLSLRTQEAVTRRATAELFRIIEGPRDLAAASVDRLAPCIRSVGMYRRKARHLIELSQELLDRFGGCVPESADDLLSLPGVGRKTANLVLSFAHGQPAVSVDTHVHRVSNRWGLVRTDSADGTECELRRLLPSTVWSSVNPLLVQHGRQICRPGRPHCSACFLRGMCRYDSLRLERQLLDELENSPPHPALGRNFADAAR